MTGGSRMTREQVKRIRDNTAADSVMHKLATECLLVMDERDKANEPLWPQSERD